MILIDEAGLAESSVPVRIYAKALGIQGFIMPGDGDIGRDIFMRTWREQPPEAGTVTVYTGPEAREYWLGAPTTVRVLLMPTEQEVPALARASDAVEWELRKQGLTPSEARALAEKAPTQKHKHFQAYFDAVKMAAMWDLLPTLPPDYEGVLEYIGDYRPPSEEKPYTVTIVTRGSDFRRLADRLRQAAENDEVIGFDVETDEEENYEAHMVGVGLAFGATSAQMGAAAYGAPRAADSPAAYYLPLNGPIEEETCLGLLQLYFNERQPPRVVAHNSKYDLQVLAKALQPDDPLRLLKKLLKRLVGDGLIAAYCLAEVDYHTGRPLPRDLKSQAEQLFGVRMLHFKEMLDLSGAKRSSEAPLTDIGPYCCADAFWGVKVEERNRQKLQRHPKLASIYERLELPSVGVTAQMELLGIPLDVVLLQKRRQEFHRRVEVYRKYLEAQAVAAGYVLKTERKMCKLHGKKKVDYENCSACDERGRVESVVPFNPNSGVQVEAVLQGTFGLPRMASTDGGAASNDEASLLRLREFTGNEDARDWITMKLAWSKDNKVLGTYLGNPDKGVEATGSSDEKGMWDRKRRHRDYNLPPGVQGDELWFIHPTWNQAVTTSSRYSSKNPNGQNIPFLQRDLFTSKVLQEAVR